MFDKLSENLKGDAAKHVPNTIKDIEKASSNLKDAYGDSKFRSCVPSSS